jgi:hypothetical protein
MAMGMAIVAVNSGQRERGSCLSGAESAPTPYRAGWRAPWRGQWGPMADGHSRLRRLATRIMAEIEAEYVVTSPLARRRAREASRLMALAEQTMAMIGTDPKATRRLAGALTRQAEAKLAHLAVVTTPTPNGNGQAVTVRRFAEAAR